MFALVLAANLFADAVRDAFDPRVRADFDLGACAMSAAGSTHERGDCGQIV